MSKIPTLKACFRAVAVLVAANVTWPAMAQEAVAPASWSQATDPFRIHGNTYYVGTRGLSSILITSPEGHILIDAGLPDSGATIAGSLTKLGFAIEDVKLIVNSHAHYEHVGSVAEVIKATNARARVAMHPWSANAMRWGRSPKSDPQYGDGDAMPPFPVYPEVQTVADGETLNVGPLRITARFTPGHTPGGTSWSWQSCEHGRCVNIVYADSLAPVAAPGYLFRSSKRYPTIIDDFQHSFQVLEAVPCDIILTPDPEVSAMWQRREAQQDQAEPNPFIESGACRTYAGIARGWLDKRLLDEPVPAVVVATPSAVATHQAGTARALNR